MTTTAAAPSYTATSDDRRSPVPAVTGVGSAAAFVGAAVLFADALAGSSSASEAAAALESSGGRTQAAVLLLTLSGLLACGVVAALADRARDAAAPAARLLLPFGVLHFVLAAAAFAPLAGALSVAGNLFDAEVSPVAAEQALVSLNALQPLAGALGAAFLLCVFAACRGGVPQWVRVSALVLGVGLLLPPVAWAIVYALPLWIAATGIALWRTAATR
jgi:hypothetical protein